MKYFFHISDTKNIESILKNGLIPNSEGEIFFFDEILDSVKIALDQLGLLEFAIFQVNIFKKDLHLDKVAERIIGNQFFSKNMAISKEKIKLMNCKKIRV